MLNMNRQQLISAIENIPTDTIDTIEWNVEFIYQDLVAHRGTKHIGLTRAYNLLADSEIKDRRRKANYSNKGGLPNGTEKNII